MRRIIIALTSLAATLMSCQREELIDPTPQVSDSDFVAVVEDFGPAAKTSMTETNRVVWSAGDELVIFQGYTLGDRYKVKDASAGTSNGVFSIVKGEGGVTDGDFTSGTELSRNVAVYPYDEDVVIDNVLDPDTEGVIGYSLSGMKIPSVQTYVEGSFAGGSFPMVAVTVDKPDHRLKFNNAAGVLKLKLKGRDVVKSIKVEGNNGELLSGGATVTAWFDDEKKPTLEMDADASTSVILDCGEGVQLSSSVATTFLIALPPTEFTKGFKVTVTDEDDVETVVEATAANTVHRSGILSMPEIRIKFFNGVFRDYIDEYGVNHGPGVEVGGVVWAPVNCGYKEASEGSNGYVWGKLYQWGRKYGHGYSDDTYQDESVAVIRMGPVSISEANSIENANIFFDMTSGSDWSSVRCDVLWNMGAEYHPIKTVYDPCPDGWRVPTKSEWDVLLPNHSSAMLMDDGTTGYCYSGEYEYSTGVSSVFLSATGGLWNGGASSQRNMTSEYWSSTPWGTDMYIYNFYFFHEWFDGQAFNTGQGSRYYAKAVRCVQDSDTGAGVPVEYLRLDKSEITISANTSYSLVPTVVSDSYTSDDIVWTSSNSSVAEVNSGTVTAISDGVAVITASIGSITSSCEVAVKSYPEILKIDYVDEWGTNHGQGVQIGETVWAPVNCGYHETDYPYGKLYQWGRKYGQGYSADLYDENWNVVGVVSDADVPELLAGPVSLDTGQSTDNAGKFYYHDSDWLDLSDDDLWNSGTEDNPVKTDYDPCPTGWRVPTSAELASTSCNYSERTTNNVGQTGYWFSGTNYSSDAPQVFFPAAGCRANLGVANSRGLYGCYWDSSATTLDFFVNSYVSMGYGAAGRAPGCSVRCVQE